MTAARGRAGCALALLCALPLAPMRALAQEEPTPFWLPTEPEAPKKKEKPKKPAAPQDEGGASIYVAPGADEVEPRKRKKGKQKPPKPATPAKAPKAVKPPPPEPEPAPEPAPAPKKRRFEPLPAFPHLEPELPPKRGEPAPRREVAPAPPPAAPSPVPAPPPAPREPEAPPVRRPVERPKREVFNPEDDAPRPPPKSAPAPAEPAPRPAEPPPPPPAPAPRAAEPQRPIEPLPRLEPAQRSPPAPLPSIPVVEPEARQRPGAVVVEPAPPPAEEPPAAYVPTPSRWRRSITVLGFGGLWQKPRGDGRAFEVAYGLQAGWAPLPWLLIDLTALRSGSTQGTSFTNASATHTLLAARLWAAWNKGLFSLLAGAGFGGVLSQTQFTLQDVNQPALTLPATALKLVLQGGVGARVRPFSGLEVRLEVTSLLRDGRFEPVLIAGAGWAF